MKALLWIWILLTALACPSFAEEAENAISFSQMQAQLDKAGADMDMQAVFDAILSKDKSFSPEEILVRLMETIKARAHMSAGFLKKTTLYLLIAAFVSRLLPNAHTGKLTYFVIHLIAALTVYYDSAAFLQNARRALSAVSGLIESATPVLVGILALTGDTHFSAFVTPMGAFVSGAIGAGLDKAGITLIRVYAALTLAGSLGEMPVKRLAEGIGSIFKWMIASAVSLFLLFMATGGAVAGAYDGAFFKGLKYAADQLIPIVGSEIAGKMDSITSGAMLLKSAAGVTGMVALLNVCLHPALDAFINLWGLKLIACILESVSDEKTTNIVEAFSKVFALMFALIAAAASMGVLFLSAVIGAGQRAIG